MQSLNGLNIESGLTILKPAQTLVSTGNISSATMYPACDRTVMQSGSVRCLGTFDPNNFHYARRQFAALYEFNEITIGPAQSITIPVVGKACIVVISIWGSIELKASNDALVAGQTIGHLLAQKGEEAVIINSSVTELSCCIQLTMEVNAADYFLEIADFKSEKNTVIRLFETGYRSGSHERTQMSMGIFDGRIKSSYIPQQRGNHVFIFVLEGAFEVEDRLLEARDGLGIAGSRLIEFEALSGNAILFIIDMPPLNLTLGSSDK